MEWRKSFYHYCSHLKILQNVTKYRSIEILFQITKRSIVVFLIGRIYDSNRSWSSSDCSSQQTLQIHTKRDWHKMYLRGQHS